MKIVLAITGASGAIYHKLLAEALNAQKDIELSVVASTNATQVYEVEIGGKLSDLYPKIHSPQDFNVPFVSGSAKMDAMVILPCSMGTLGRIAHGISNDSITRAADVFLKEHRKLILVPRETPYNLIHLENMVKLTQAGATILPATPSFYGGQKTIEDVANTVVSRLLDHLGVDNHLAMRWKVNEC